VTENIPNYSVSYRFVVSFFFTFFRSGISFATGILLARWLGVGDYGAMSFLLATFVAVKQLLDMGTSAAFFTFISRGVRSHQFVKYYWYWVGVQFLVSLLAVSILIPESLFNIVWLGEERSLVVLALLATFMQNHAWPIASKMAEANRETVIVQRLSVFIALVHLLVVILLWWHGMLMLPLLFSVIAVEWFIVTFLAAKLYRKKNITSGELIEKNEKVSAIVKEYWVYCLPLIPYVWLGFFHDFADRWMLQLWGGSEGQAYYAVAKQFAGVSLLATSAMIQILWKEIAEAYSKGNYKRVFRVYDKASKALLLISAFSAGVLIPWSGELIQLMLGAEYIGGSIVLAIMFIYPIHQSLGQLGGAMLYAVGDTRLHVILGSLFMVVGLAASYFMLAPNTMLIPGLSLSAEGLALKMVVMQFIHVNILGWFIARMFNWKYKVLYQVVGVSVFVGIGYMAYHLSFWLLRNAELFTNMAASAFMYVFLSLSIVFLVPSAFGVSRNELYSYIGFFKIK